MRRLLVSVAMTAASSAALAQAPVKGAMLVKVTDTRDSALWGAEVQLPTLGVTFPVPDNGVLLIRDVAAGGYVLQVRRVGYAQQTRLVKVIGSDTSRVNFAMQPTMASLDTVRVDETRGQWFADFDRRRKGGIGQYFTSVDIAEAHAPRLSSFLSRARGLKLTIGNPDILSSLRAMGRCPAVQIYLDGMLVSAGDAVPTTMAAIQDPRLAASNEAIPTARGGSNPPTPPTTTSSPGSGSGSGTGSGTGAGTPPKAPPPTAGAVMKSGVSIPSSRMSGASGTRFDINSIPQEMIAAIEIYLDVAGIPPLYRGTHDECGVILLWTK
jgi:hypothetical protein